MIAVLVTIKISIADLIGGTRGVSSGEPWAPLHVKKSVLISTVKNMLKFENF